MGRWSAGASYNNPWIVCRSTFWRREFQTHGFKNWPKKTYLLPEKPIFLLYSSSYWLDCHFRGLLVIFCLWKPKNKIHAATRHNYGIATWTIKNRLFFARCCVTLSVYLTPLTWSLHDILISIDRHKKVSSLLWIYWR